MIAAMGLITTITAQATDETVTISKEEYESLKKSTEINKNENTGKEYKKYNDTPVKIENISEDEYNKYNEEVEKSNKIVGFILCSIFVMVFVGFLYFCIKNIKFIVSDFFIISMSLGVFILIFVAFFYTVSILI